MDIGTKIKKLRKQRGITQEQLANSLGISFQAVSKWETGIALPDIGVVPALASYFGVSIDELFDFSLCKINDDISRIVGEAAKFRESDPEESRRLLESGLKKYPENDILLNNLLYVLTDSDEIISTANALISRTSQSDVKYDALRFLAYAYKEKGDLKSAEAAVEQIPEIYFTKLTEMAYLLEGRPKFEAAEKQKWISFENLLQMMWKLAECYESSGEIQKAISETEKALSLVTVMQDLRFDNYIEYFNKQLGRLKNMS